MYDDPCYTLRDAQVKYDLQRTSVHILLIQMAHPLSRNVAFLCLSEKVLQMGPSVRASLVHVVSDPLWDLRPHVAVGNHTVHFRPFY